MNIGDRVEIIFDSNPNNRNKKGCIVDIIDNNYHIKIENSFQYIAKSFYDILLIEPNYYKVDKVVDFFGFQYDVTEKDNNYSPPVKESPCQCGALKTYGKDCKDWFHSDWCKMYRKPRD